MTDASLTLQIEIITALKADAAVGVLVGDKIFDYIKSDQVMPYIEMADGDVLVEDTKTTDGMDHTVEIHIWSEHKGKKEVYEIAEAVEAVLHNQPLTLDTHTLIILRRETRTYLTDADGIRRHAILRFKAITEAD